MAVSTLSCVLCGRTYPFEDRFRCDCADDSLLDVNVDLSRFPSSGTPMRRLRRYVRSVKAPGRNSGVWRFKRLVLPDLPDDDIVSRGEGNTRIYEFPRTNAWLGNPRVLFKHEGENPTGSFKDRGMTVAVSWAKHCGARTIACASTGNTAAAVASYASLAGMQAVILVSEKATALGKIAQSLAYGARTVKVRGNFDDALALLLECRERLDLTVMNSVNPFRLEGQKTIMFEMLEQIGWSRPPDWVVVPGGNLGNAAAFGKALKEAHTLGLIPRIPRLAIVQAAGADPFYRAWRDGWDRYATMTPDTVATAIRIGAPVNLPKARRSLQWTNGVVTEVDDDAIMHAKAMIDSDGVGCEPASAATAAGIKRLMAEGVIAPDESVVAVLTGHLLKDPGATVGYHEGSLGPDVRSRLANAPVVIDPTPQALAAALARTT